MKGNAQFNDVCLCQGANHVASVCSVANGSTDVSGHSKYLVATDLPPSVIIAPSGLSLRHPPAE
jgi:hypothetical protein